MLRGDLSILHGAILHLQLHSDTARHLGLYQGVLLGTQMQTTMANTHSNTAHPCHICTGTGPCHYLDLYLPLRMLSQDVFGHKGQGRRLLVRATRAAHTPLT